MKAQKPKIRSLRLRLLVRKKRKLIVRIRQIAREQADEAQRMDALYHDRIPGQPYHPIDGLLFELRHRENSAKLGEDRAELAEKKRQWKKLRNATTSTRRNRK